jgi:hypothetical protein
MTRAKQFEQKTDRSNYALTGASTMYAKFPFYSIAQIYAIGLNVPVSILLGRDNLYWVVDQQLAGTYTRQGCSTMKTSK